MIYTPSGEPVEIIGGPFAKMFDSDTREYPYVDIRFLNPPTERLRFRIALLRADGGAEEILTAIGAIVISNILLNAPEINGGDS